MTLKDLPLAGVAQRCLDQPDEDAWLEFVRRIQPLVAGVVVKTGRRCGFHNSSFDDLIQEVFLKLCHDQQRILAVALGKDEASFFGYIKVITANVVLDQHKHRIAGKRNVLVEQELDYEVPQSSDNMGLLRLDVQRILSEETVAPRDRQIFWLYYKQGFSAGEIAGVTGPDLGVKGVESCIHRLTSMLRERFTSRVGVKGGEL